MSWTSLSSTLATKPRVLAGPMLRQVTPTSVTVWLALRMPTKVTLTVLDPGGAIALTGSRATVAVGPNLHIVAVTATPLPPLPSTASLSQGVVYRYDLRFDFTDKAGMPLPAATDIAPLHLWGDRALGDADSAPLRGRFVLLLRSSLLRRYPNAVVYIARALRTGGRRVPSTEPADERQPIFIGSMPPDVSFFGFDVTTDEATGADGTDGYYVVIQEHPTEPRFGMPDGVSVGLASHLAVSTAPPAGPRPDGLVWGRNAAHMAGITRRLPVRLAVHASQFLTSPDSGSRPA